MTTKETTLNRCVAVHKVPINVSDTLLTRQIRTNIHNVNIVRFKAVEGAEVSSEFRRWVFEIGCEGDVKRLIEELKYTDIEVDGTRYTLEFHAPDECDVIDWIKEQRPEVPKKPDTRNPLYNANPMMSGFYTNIPGSSSGSPMPTAAGSHPGYGVGAGMMGGQQQHQAVPPGYGQHPAPPGSSSGSPMPTAAGSHPDYGVGAGMMGGQQQHQAVPPGYGQHPAPPGSSSGSPMPTAGSHPDYGVGAGMMGGQQQHQAVPPGYGQHPAPPGSSSGSPMPTAAGSHPDYGVGAGMMGGQQQHQAMPPGYGQHPAPPAMSKPPMSGAGDTPTMPYISCVQNPYTGAQQLMIIDHLTGQVMIDEGTNQPVLYDPTYQNAYILNSMNGCPIPYDPIARKAAPVTGPTADPKPFEPPPPYNGQSSKVAGPSTSKAVTDQMDYMGKLQAKLQQESRDTDEHMETEPQVVEAEATSEVTKIIVRNLSPDITDDVLEMFFESKKTGFGSVEVNKIEMNENEMYAIIELDTPQSVETVLQKCPLTIMSRQVTVELYSVSANTSGSSSTTDEVIYDGTQTSITVSNLPEGVDEEYLEMFFEKKKVFGDTLVKSVKLYEEHSFAIIEFQEPRHVECVLGKCPPKMKDRDIDIKIYVKQPLTTIKVTGPATIVNSNSFDTLEMYFETEKRSAGGNIVDIRCGDDEQMVYVTYETEDVARRVVEHGNHKVSKQTLTVELHDPLPIPSNGDQSNLKRSRSQTDDSMETMEKKSCQPTNAVCTVKVRGMKKIESRESVSLYFENQNRAGGGPIESCITDDEDDDVLYITYKHKQVAEAVSKRQHKVGGVTLDAALHIPPPCYPNKLLIKGMNTTTREATLGYFLEAKADCVIVEGSMTYHAERDDVVLVTTEADIDIDELRTACEGKELEGHCLQVCPVPISSCISVVNIDPDVTKDTIELYFQNKRRAHGGPIDKTVFEPGKDTAYIYFTDYKTVDEVLCHTHKLGGKTLDVNRYMPCIAKAEGESRDRRPKLPNPITIKVDTKKIKFVKKSETTCIAFANQMTMVDAKIEWPAENSDTLTITCTIDLNTRDAAKKVKDWKHRAQSNFEDFMNNVACYNMRFAADMLVKLKEKLAAVDIENPSAVAVVLSKQDSVISIVGLKTAAEPLSGRIQALLDKTREEVERKKQTTKETITNLKLIETKMLLADKFPTQMKETLPDLSVRINQTKNEVVFEGIIKEIQAAEIKMYERKDKYKTRQLPIQRPVNDLYNHKNVREIIIKKLKRSQVVAVWEVLEETLVIMSTDEDNLGRAVNIVQQSVITRTVPISKASASVLQSESWRTKQSEMLENNCGCLLFDLSDLGKMVIASTDDIANDVLQNITKFLQLNTVLEEKMFFSKSVHKLLDMHHKDKINTIAKSLESCYVSIIVLASNQGFEVRGTADGLNQAKAQLENLASKVQKERHTVNRPGLGEYMKSAKGQEIIMSIERNHKVVVSTEEEEESGAHYSAGTTATSSHSHTANVQTRASCTAYDIRKIYIAYGDMSDMKVDALVNNTDKKLGLVGGLGKVLLTKGGAKVGQSCRDYIQNEGELGEGEVFMGSAGTLNVKSIIHVVGPEWTGGESNECDKLEEVVFKAMKQASMKQYKTMALPAVSCGINGFPVKKATGIIVKSVKNFFRELQDSTIEEIYLCDVKEYTVRAFIDALSNEFGQQNINITPVRKPPTQPKPKARGGPPTITPTTTSSEEEDGGNYATGRQPGPVRGQPSTVMAGGIISVTIDKAELAKYRVDMIVNTTARNLDLNNGAVSKTILKSAGSAIQEELLKKFPKGLQQQGDVAVTKGYNMNCKHVAHGSVMSWDSGSGAIQDLEMFVITCLTEADTLNHSSIAFPAVGTGNLGYPKDIVAQEMFKAISTFAVKKPQTSLRKVVFVLYPKDYSTVKAFEAEEKRLLPTAGASGGQGHRKSRGKDTGRRFNRYNQDDDSKTGQEDVYMSADSTGDYRFGNVQITVKQGDITVEDSTCIVNSSNEGLDLNRGAVSKALLKKCGDKLAQEAAALKKKMKHDRIVKTSAPNLACQKIIHCVAKDTAGEWKGVVKKCLQLADENGFQSISFPALGTGMNISPEEIGESLVNAVREFAQNRPKSVQDVRFVIFQPQMVKEFHAALKKAGANAAGASGRSSGLVARASTSNKVLHPDLIKFILLSLDRGTIETAIQRLETCIEKEMHKKEFKDSIILRLDSNQLMEIKAMAEGHGVKYQYVNGKIEIVGVMDNLLPVSDSIHRVMREATAIEQEKRSAVIMKDLIQWYYIEKTDGVDEFKPYEPLQNYQIERAYTNSNKTFEFIDNGDTIVVDFGALVEYSKKTPNDRINVMRKDLIKDVGGELSRDWKPMKGNLLVHDLDPACADYTDIVSKFTASSGGAFAVHSVRRVQNKTLWLQYEAKKKQLDAQNPKGTTNERLLWHGTADETIDSVNAHGFNRSYCGKNATAYGDGVYFAVSAQYSASDTYSRPGALGLKKMYYCKVLTGQITTGKQGMRVAPPNPAAGKNGLFDSVTNNIQNPAMFIIFNDTQAYPLYILSFKKK